MIENMKFELNEYHKNISQDDLLNDLKRVANMLNKNYLSKHDYEKYGRYSANPYIRNFGSWLKACELAGLKTIRDKEDFQHITDNNLLHDMQLVSEYLNKKSISTKDYNDYGKYKVQTVLTRFKTWSDALDKAGLEQTSFKIINDRDLFNEIERVWILKGKQPTTTDVKKGLFKYSLNTYCRRFGGWRNALESFIEYINIDYTEENEDNEDNGSYGNIVIENDNKNNTQIEVSSKKNIEHLEILIQDCDLKL